MAGLDPLVAPVTSNPVLSGPDEGTVLRSSAVSLAGAAVSATVNIGMVIYLARTISQDLLGAFATGQSWFLVLMVLAELGVTTGLVYFLSQLRARGQLTQLRPYLVIAVAPISVTSVAAAVGLWIAAPLVLGPVATTNPELVTSLRVLAVMLPLAVITEVANSASLGLGYVAPTIVIDRFCRPILQAVLIILCVTMVGPAWISGMWGLAFIPLAVAALAWFMTLGSRSAPGWIHIRSDARASSFWRYTGPRAVTTGIQVMLQRLDIILVAAIAGVAPAAVYVAATRFVVVAQMGNQAISTVLQPRIAEANAVSDHPRIAALFQVSTGWLVLLTWPVLLMALAFAPQVMEIFGSGYQDGILTVRILAIAMLFATGVGLVDVVLLMSGGSGLALMNHLLALVVMVVLDLWLIPIIGLTGAALGWAAALAVKNGLPMLQIRHRVHISPLALSSGIAYLICAMSFGVVPAIVVTAWGASWATAAISLVAGAAIMAAGCVRFRDQLQLVGIRKGADR